ncbi:MAG: FtsH protease activity modulator HflK [Candidatus Azosocius agrarius]|nr:MAG: FtsH protease activity modulator HflK [Gammaproteobacteria bacterium]
MKKNVTFMAWNEPNVDKNSKSFVKRFRDVVLYFLKIFKKKGVGGNIFDKKSFNYFGSSFYIIVFCIIVIGYIIAGIYIVKPAEKAVVTRFGKYQRILEQGPHWIPLFLEKKRIINTEKLERNSHGASMLTKDENIVNVEIEVQYRINNAEKRLFNIAEPDKVLREASDSALRQVIGNSDLDFIVTSGKEQISNAIAQQLQTTLDSYDAGVYIAAVALREARVPTSVKSAFDDVIKAREEKEQLKHQAEAFANRVVPEANGKAAQMLEEANAYKQETILLAEGDVIRFQLILDEYKKAPDITKKRLYLEMMEYVLSKVSKILIDSDSNNNLIYLPVDKLMGTKSGINKVIENQVYKERYNKKESQGNTLPKSTDEVRNRRQ